MTIFADRTFKLFKLHGYVNWFKRVTAPISVVDPQREEKDLINELISRAAIIKTGEFRISSVGVLGKLDQRPVWPAIAIPVTSKKMFECPAEHLEAVKQLLPETERIVTIGWRGAENHFLKILAEALANRELRILPVAVDQTGAQQVVENCRSAGIRVVMFDAQDGFSNTIVARTIEDFCKR